MVGPTIFPLFCAIVILFSTDNVVARKAMYRPTAAHIHARAYDGFQYMEPCLIPMGTYIALDVIPSQLNLSSAHGNPAGKGNGTSLQEVVVDVIEAEIDPEDNGDEQDGPGMQKVSKRRTARVQLQPPIYGLAGIRPLSTTRLAMGIFIPDRYIADITGGDSDDGGGGDGDGGGGDTPDLKPAKDKDPSVCFMFLIL